MSQRDVRPEQPARRHQPIFETHSALDVGESFELVDDHDWRIRTGRTAP